MNDYEKRKEAIEMFARILEKHPQTIGVSANATKLAEEIIKGAMRIREYMTFDGTDAAWPQRGKLE